MVVKSLCFIASKNIFSLTKIQFFLMTLNQTRDILIICVHSPSARETESFVAPSSEDVSRALVLVWVFECSLCFSLWRMEIEK